MFDNLIQLLAPHHCYFCNQNGEIVCRSCIYNITEDSFSACFGCKALSAAGVCRRCAPRLPFASCWVVAERQGAVKQLLHDYKFSRLYAAHKALASLLDAALPILPSGTVVVAVPTISRHIRLRGYDHAALLARRFAQGRRLAYKPLLARKTNSVQVGANKTVRQSQAKQAFSCPSNVPSDVPYLIIDDIITTGATVVAASRCLKQAGAKQIMVAAIAC